MRPDLRKRLADSVETAVALADGIVDVELVDDGRAILHVLRALRVPALRHLDARARAADLLVQLARTAPARAAPGWARRWRSTPSWSCPTRRCRSARARSLPWSTERVELLRADHAGDRRDATRSTWTTPWEDLPEEQRDLLPVRHERRPRLHLLPQPLRAPALVHDALRGHRPQPRAPLPRDRLRLVAREDRGVHVGAAVPGVPGRAAAARVAGGAGRRHRRSTSSRRCRRTRALEWLERARADRHRAPDRAADPARDRRAAALPRRRRRRLPVAGPGRGARSRAARRSGSGWPPRSARRWSACSTSSTSRRSACTSATTSADRARSSACATSATR